jgi:hypothetical protein
VLPVRNAFQKLSCTEQRREGVVAYLWVRLYSVPTRYLVPIDCSIFPGQDTKAGGIDTLDSIFGLLEYKIPFLLFRENLLYIGNI